MKKVLIFSALFLLASVSLSAQVVKGAGLWYFNSVPNVTPSVATGTEVAYSINNKALYKWNRTTSAWVVVVQDSSITNELQDLILLNDTLSLTLSNDIVLMAQYRNHVWEIANLSDTTSITGDIEGDIAYTSTGDTIAFRGTTAWLPFTGGGGGGTFNSFNIAGDTGSDVVTDGQTVTIAGGYGINTAESGGTVTVTADTTQLATQSDISGFGTMSSFTVAGGSGTPQTITNGNTLTLSEGYGINTLAAATDNVRTEVDTTQIATAFDISTLMTNWILGGTSGTPQTVSSGQTATIAAGTGMTTTAGATRTVTVAIANTGVTAATYGSASQVPVFAVNAQGQLTTATNTAIQIAISQVTGLSDSLASHPSGTGTNLRIPVWTGSNSLGSSTLLQSATGQTLDANLAFRITGGTTASRPTGVAGMKYYNTSLGFSQTYDGTNWLQSDFPAGTTSYTTRFDGSNWVASSVLQNDGTSVRVVGGSNRFLFNPSGFTDGLTVANAFASLNTAESAGVITAYTALLHWFRPTNLNAGSGVLIAPASNSVTTAVNTVLTINHNSALTLTDWRAGANTVARLRSVSTSEGALDIIGQGATAGRGLNVFQHVNSVAGAPIAFIKSRGTAASPTIVSDGDALGAFSFQGYTGTQYLTDVGLFGGIVTGSPTSTTMPTSIYIRAGSTSSSLIPQFIVHSGGNVGIGPFGTLGSTFTAPSRLLHVNLSDAVTNAISFVGRFTHATSGTAAAGSGAGIEFEAESAGGTNRVAGTIENPYTTATNAAEVSDLVFRTMRGGTLTEGLRSLGNGTLQIGTLSGTATQMVGATAGNILCPITLGTGFSFSSGTLNGAFLPLAGGTMLGNILFTDNTYDIGASGATRPRTGYFGTSVVSPVFNATTGFQVAGAATSGNYLRGNGTNFVSSAIQAGDIPTLNYLPLTLTGATEVNTAGQNLYIRDAGGYPYTFMNSNYWIAVSDVNTYMDVGSTSGTLTGNSATRMYLASAGTWEAQAASELRLDADSILIDATLPVNTNATHVLVRDASTQRLEEKALSSFGNGIISALPAGDVTISTSHILTIDDGLGNDEIRITPSSVELVDASANNLTIQTGDIQGNVMAMLFDDLTVTTAAGDIELNAGTDNVSIQGDTANISAQTRISGNLGIGDTDNGDGLYIAAYTPTGVLTRANLTGGSIQFDDGVLNISNTTETVADTVTRTLGTGQQIYANGFAHYSGSGFSYASGRVTNASGAIGTYELQYSFTAESTSGTVDMVVKTQIWDGATYTAFRAGQKTMTIKAGELISGSHSTVITLPDGDGVNISFSSTNGCEISDFTYTLRKI